DGGRRRGGSDQGGAGPLQPTVWRHLHGSPGTFSETRPRFLPGARIEENLLRRRACPVGALQPQEHRESEDASEIRFCSLRAHSDRFRFALSLGIARKGMYQNHKAENASPKIPLPPFP